MLLAMPYPYPDETVYSLCARLAHRLMIPRRSGVNELIFGRSRKKHAIGLPQGLNRLATFYPYMDTQQLIDAHTALPFYAPFLSAERHQLIRQRMMEDGKQAIIILPKSDMPILSPPKQLRYCPACAAEHRSQYGETYWNRLHQLPGIVVCHKHRCWLESSDVSVERSGYDAAKFAIPPSDKSICRMVEDEDSHLLTLADNALSLFDMQGKHSDLRTRYMVTMAEQGYATYSGTIRTERLSAAFLDHYSKLLLSQLGLTIDNTKRRNQLTQLVQSKKAKHPVHHMLLILFLGYDVKQFFGRTPHIEPFGEPLWPCLNSVCDSYRKPVIETCVLGFSRSGNRQPTGTFICPMCGFCYSRMGVDKMESDRYRVGLIRAYGHVWDEKLKQCWSEHNGNVKAIMEVMACSREAINYNSFRLGLIDRPKKGMEDVDFGRYGDIPTAENIEVHRQQWLAILAENTVVPMATIYKAHSKTHLWLDRHDHVWLKANTPERRQGRKSVVDWEARDQTLSEQVKQVVDELRASTPLLRITSNRIAQQLGYGRSFKKRDLDRMPHTATILADVVETHEQFALRRLEWVTEQLVSDGVTFTKSVLIKSAGLSDNVRTEQVERRLNQLIAEHKPP